MITRKSGSLPAEQCASVTASHLARSKTLSSARMAADVHLVWACASVCVPQATSQTDETCGIETGASLWCNQQLPQRYNMQLIGVKDKKKSWWASLLSRHDLL